MKRLWKKLTRSESPQDWSRKKRTPILSMINLSERITARRVFAAECLNSQPSFLKVLSDKRRIDEVFRTELLGDKKFLLNDLDEVRTALERNFGEAYTWSENPAVAVFLEKMAREKYFLCASERAAEKLLSMDSERAKEFLLKLVRENYAVGMEILRGDVK